MTNPYATLGVSRDASQDEIKKAFKKLARKYHPDINKDPGAETRFKEVNAAYDAIGDSEKRKLFDEFGEASLKPGFDAQKARAWQQASGGFPGGSGFQYEFQGMDMEDFISSIFNQTAGGRQSGRRRTTRGADQRLRVNLPAMLTFLGGDHPIAVRRPNGSVDRLTVRIPAGAKDGGKLKLQGQGLPPRGGGPCGDLILELHVPDHPVLRRRGDDLEMDVPLTVLESMKGAQITVPTPTGDVKVTIPAGAASGTKMRIRGRGVQKRAKPGDLYLVLQTQVPDTEDPALHAAAEALEAAYAGDVRASLKL